MVPLWAFLCSILYVLGTVYARNGSETHFVALLDSKNQKQSEVIECRSRGGFLAMDLTAASHEKLIETMNGVTQGEYYAYLGGSLDKSRSLGCPEPASKVKSLNCIWFWNHGRYAADGFKFYQGNLHPTESDFEPGLDGAKGFRGVPTYWYKNNGVQVAPAELYNWNVVLFSNCYASHSWIDNGPGPGFDYLQDKRLGKFYSLCQIDSPETPYIPIGGVGSTCRSPNTRAEMTGLNSGTGDSSTAGSSTGGIPNPGTLPWYPTTPKPIVPPSSNGNEEDGEKGNTAAQIGVIVAIVVVIIAALALCCVCCCCRDKVLAFLCREKALVDEEEMDDEESETTSFSSDENSCNNHRSASEASSSSSKFTWEHRE